MRLMMLALAGLLFLSACGKKAPLRPPGSDRPPAQENEDESPDDLFEDRD